MKGKGKLVLYILCSRSGQPGSCHSACRSIRPPWVTCERQRLTFDGCFDSRLSEQV